MQFFWIQQHTHSDLENMSSNTTDHRTNLLLRLRFNGALLLEPVVLSVVDDEPGEDESEVPRPELLPPARWSILDLNSLSLRGGFSDCVDLTLMVDIREISDISDVSEASLCSASSDTSGLNSAENTKTDP